MRAAASDLLERAQFADRAGLSFRDRVTGVFNRDLRKAAGYRDSLSPKDYRDRYLRGGVAARIVTAYPKATWLSGVELQEDPRQDKTTDFEREAELLFDRLGIWARLMRADILAGLGTYSVLLVGVADGKPLEQPMAKLKDQKDVLYLTPLGEDRATIAEFEEDKTSERYGLPKTYLLTLGTPKSSALIGRGIPGGQAKVHWSRVLHVAEGVLEDDVYGEPRLRAVFDRLDDLDKVLAGGAEASWKRADPGMQLELDPTVKFTTTERDNIEAQITEYQNNLRRILQTRGVKINQLANSVAGFGPNADAIMDQIAGTTGIPKRILMGSERGELSSTQDRENWAARVQERRKLFAEPLVLDLVKRLVKAGALPEPKQLEIQWPKVEELSEATKAEIAGAYANANAAQKAVDGNPLVTGDEIRSKVLDLGPLEEAQGYKKPEPAPAPGAGVPGEPAGTGAPPAAQAPASGPKAAPAAQPPKKGAPQPRAAADGRLEAVTGPADARVPALRRAFAEAALAARDAVDLGELERALATGARGEIERLAEEAMKLFAERLDEELPARIAGAGKGLAS